MRRKWKDDLTPEPEPAHRPPKREPKRFREMRARIRAMQERPLDQRRRAIWEIYWQPNLPWYPAVAEVAAQFGVSRQTVHNTRAWAIKNGLPVREKTFRRCTLSPFDALEMCKRLWGTDAERDRSLPVDDIVAEYGIAKRTAYSVYRPRYAAGELQEQCEKMQRAWQQGG